MTRLTLWQIPEPEPVVIENLRNKSIILTHRLTEIANNYHNIRFATSLAAEDMVITDVIAKNHLNINIFTLNTGLLHKETLDLLDTIGKVYPNIHIQSFYPHSEAIQKFMNEQGKHAYYESVELRRKCCFLRKIEPLNRALIGADVWLTGQRREQSATRTELSLIEKDKNHNIDKYNPLFDWSEQEIWAYILVHQVPYNPLYRQGFPSIGCDPCTRPIKQDEDIRAGRWWWENKDSKECGLHK